MCARAHIYKRIHMTYIYISEYTFLVLIQPFIYYYENRRAFRPQEIMERLDVFCVLLSFNCFKSDNISIPEIISLYRSD